MMKKKKTAGKKKVLPKFKTEAEEQEFWSKNDFTDYLNEFEAAKGGEIELDLKLIRRIKKRTQKKHLVAVRLDDEQYIQAQKLALKKNMGLSTLIRSWIARGIWHEMGS